MVTVSYVVPVFPNINEYINIILLIAHPLVGIYLCSSLIAYKSDRVENMRDYAKHMKRNKIRVRWYYNDIKISEDRAKLLALTVYNLNLRKNIMLLD